MPKQNHHTRLDEIELLIFRAASIVFILLMLYKIFKAEISAL